MTGTDAPAITAAERWRYHITAVVIVTALALVHQHRQIFFGEIPRWWEVSEQYEPMRAYQARAYKAGRIPVWCTTMGLGLPMLAMSEDAVFHPANILVFSLMDAREGDLLIGVVRMVLAGVFAYGAARALGVGFFGGLLSAVVFQFNGFLTPRKWLMLSHASWIELPLMLVAADRLATRPRPWTVVWGSAVIGLSLLSGHYQLQFIALLFYGFYGLWRLFQAWCGFGCFVRRGLLLLAPVVLGSALAAVQLIATADLQPLTGYAGSEAPEGSGRAGSVFSTYRHTNSFPPHHVNMYVLPFLPDGDEWLEPHYRGGLQEVFVYVGILPLMLACVAWRRRRWAPFAPLLASVLVFTALSCGRFLPGYDYLVRLPGFGWFVYPSRFAFPVALCVGLLAGVGLEEMLAARRDRMRRWVRPAAIGIGVAVALALAVPVIERAVFGADPDAPPWKTLLPGKAFRASWSLPAILASVFVFSLLARKWQYAAVAAVLVASADMMSYWFWFPKGMTYEPQPPYILNQPGPILKHLPPPGDTRIGVGGGTYAGLAIAGHPMMNVYPPFVPFRAPWATRVTSSNRFPDFAHLFRALRIRFLLHRHDIKDPRLRLLWHGVDLQVYYLHGRRVRDWNLYEFSDVLPRAYLVDRAEWYGDPEAARRRAEDPSFDAARTVVLEGVPPAGVDTGPARPTSAPQDESTVARSTSAPLPATPGSAVIDVDTETRVSVRVHADRPAWLVLSDGYYRPGWRAFLDGEETALYPADFAVRAVRVPAGESTVEFVFRPRSLRVGLPISLATLALLTAAAGAIAVRRLTRSKRT